MRSWDTLLSWVVCCAAFITHILTIGFAYVVSVYYVEFLSVFGENNGTTAWISSLNMGMLCGIGPVASLMIHRFGLRVTMFVGGFLGALAFGLCAFATEFYMVVLTFGLLSGVGAGLVYTAAVVVIGVYFDKYRPLALGLSSTGGAIGNIVNPWISSGLISTFGWRGAILMSGGLVLNICVCAMLLIKPREKRTVDKDPKEHMIVALDNDNQPGKELTTKVSQGVDNKAFKSEPIEAPNNKTGKESKTKLDVKNKSNENEMSKAKDAEILHRDSIAKQTKDILCNPFYILFLCNCAMFLFGAAVVYTHILSFVKSEGNSPTMGRTIVSALGASSLAGRIGLGILSQLPCVNTIVLYIVAVLLCGVSIVSLAVWTSPLGLLVCSCVFGLCVVSFGPTAAEVAFLIAGPKRFNFAVGYKLIVMGVGWILGAPAAGILYDVTQHYPNSFYLGGGVMIAGALVMVPVAILLKKDD